MNLQVSTLFCLCIAVAIPVLVLSTSQYQANDELDELDLQRLAQLNYQRHHPMHRFLNEHYLYKKAADFEQILRPCNQIPASGRGHEYSDCVRSRMLLMGRRRRQAS